MIETLRTRLRPFTSEDFDNLRLLDSDPDVMRFTPAKVPQTEEQTRGRLKRYSEHPGIWAAEEKVSGVFLGWFMLIDTDLPHPEIGFMLVKKFWGQGLASEIVSEIIDYAFLIEGFSALSARTTPDNAVSIHVLKKLGFREKGAKISAQNKELLLFELRA